MNLLHMGQSNALCRRTGGAPFSELLPLVECWNNAPEWGSNKGTTFRAPIQGSNPYGPNNENNAGVWFAHRLAQATGQTVRHVLSARGAHGIEHWVGSTRPGWDDLTAVVAAIEAAGETVRPFDVFFWQGSESNSANTIAQYRPWWNELIATMESGGYITAATPIIIAGIKKATAAHIDSEHQSIAATDPRVAYAPGFATMTADDGVHWSGKSQVTMGASAFCAWQQLGA